MTELVYKNENENPVTNSLLVAEKFEKEHKDVLRDIRNLTAQFCAVRFPTAENLTAENSAVRNMFVETTYISSRGRDEPIFVMNRDGFSLLAMGFTGEKALQFKLEYINAFNKMEQALRAILEEKVRLAEVFKEKFTKKELAHDDLWNWFNILYHYAEDAETRMQAEIAKLNERTAMLKDQVYWLKRDIAHIRRENKRLIKYEALKIENGILKRENVVLKHEIKQLTKSK